MTRWLPLGAVFLSIGLISFSCGQAGTPTLSPELKTLATKVAPKTNWEQRWENTLAEAKKEGTVMAYVNWRPEIRIAISQAFKQKHGIDVEFVGFGRAADMMAKVKTEQTAGLYIVDIFGAGSFLVNTMKPAGLLGNLEPLLILPEIIEPKAWRGGEVPFMDKDKTAMAMIASLQRYILYNTELVKEGEITTYKDLLKSQYKGKITINDPTITGSGNAFISHLAFHLWGKEEAANFLKQLLQLEPVITRDNNLQVEWVARGKYAIALGPEMATVGKFLNLRAPLSLVVVKEGAFISAAAGGVAIPTRLSNPRAATIFLNWLLSKEGQSVAYTGFEAPSNRIDVPLEGIQASLIPQSGEKLYLDSEDYIKFRGESPQWAKDIIGAYIK